MDTLIRSTRLAPVRTRLSDVRALSEETEEERSPPQSDRDLLRRQVEEQLRSELSAELREFRAAEYERLQAEGYAEGLAKAQETVANEVARVQEKLTSALSAMELAHTAALSKLEASVGEVAFAAICRFVRNQAVSAELVLGIVEQTCAQLRADVIASVRLHPRNVRVLSELLQENGEIKLRSLGLRVIPDESLEPGGCVVEAASGQYDGGLESQLRRLHAVLTAAEG